MRTQTLQQLLTMQSSTEMYGLMLDILWQVSSYDTASILEPHGTADWSITAWRNYEVPVRLLAGFRCHIEHDPAFGAAFSTRQITHITTQERSIIWRHAEYWIAVPLLLEDEVIGIASLEGLSPFSDDTLQLLVELSSWFALALNNLRQVEAIQQTSSILANVHEAERDAVADVLHDDIADVLSLVKKSMVRSQKLLSSRGLRESENISQAIKDLSNVVEDARRLSHGLAAKRLVDRFDLLEALEILIDNFSMQTQIDVEFIRELSVELQLDNAVKIAIYRIVQEGLTNASRYAEVNYIEVRLISNAEQLVVHIRDEGHGFDTSIHPSGIGLTGMQQRTLIHNGKFDLYSQPGHGTHIIADFPMNLSTTTHVTRAENARILMNLIAFARLYGYVRYFYPDDAIRYVDWDQIVTEGVQLVENAEDDNTLRKRLLSLFSPIAPQLEIYTPDTLLSYDPPSPEDYIILWRHHGFGVGNSMWHLSPQQRTTHLQAMAKLNSGNRDGSSSFLSELEIHPTDAFPTGYPSPAEPFLTYLTDNLICRMPLALYTENIQHTITDRLKGVMDLPQRRRTDDKLTQNLAAIIILWNIFQHFSPRFLDNEGEHLHQAFHSILEGTDVAEQVLRLLMARLDDDAARVRIRRPQHDDTNRYAPPFLWEYVGENPVITQIIDRNGHELQVGDIVERINGQTIEDTIKQEIVYISGTLLDHRRRRALRYIWRGNHGSYMTLDIRRNGNLSHHRIYRTIHIRLIPEQSGFLPPAVIAPLKHEIYYIDLMRLQRQQLLRSMARLKASSGLILDARGAIRTGSAIETLIAHLIEVPTPLTKLYIPRIYWPDGKQIVYDAIQSNIIKPLQPYFDVPVVVLINHHSSGRIEHYLHVFKHLPNVTFIGKPSAGTIGNTDLFTILETYDVSWTIAYAQGNDAFTGIRPDVPCDHMFNCDDNLLDQAILWMRKTQ